MQKIIQSIAAFALLATSAFAGELVNVSGASKIAVNGYDPIAFFTEAKAVNGSPFISAGCGSQRLLRRSASHQSPCALRPQC